MLTSVISALIEKYFPYILIASLLFTVWGLIKYNSHLKKEYTTVNNELTELANQQAINDKLISEVRVKQDENDQNQKNALVQMHNKGYLPDSNGDNPDWMCASPDGCRKDQSTLESD